jgi:uncharacterized coiled-coil protein SlyX
MNEHEELVTAAVAAERTGLPVRTIREWMLIGKLASRLGMQARLVRMGDVLALQAARAARVNHQVATRRQDTALPLEHLDALILAFNRAIDGLLDAHMRERAALAETIAALRQTIAQQAGALNERDEQIAQLAETNRLLLEEP